MNYQKLQNIDKLIINTDDIARALSIGRESAQVTASRYISSDRLVRLKRDTFILPQKLKNVTEEELFKIANLLQTPSYISLTSALSYYDISTQQMRYFVESIGLKRTIEFNVADKVFTFTKVKNLFYCGFNRLADFFIASPEKALADSIYLTSMKRYNADFDAVDFTKINKGEVDKYLSYTNKAAENLWQKLIKNYKL